MEKLFKSSFFLFLTFLIICSDVYAAAIPGTTEGFKQQKDHLTKSFNITYPAGAGAAEALPKGAESAIDNWHKTEDEFLRNLKENFSQNPEPGRRPAGASGAPAMIEWKGRQQLWSRIRSAVYARASMTIVYDQAMRGGGFKRHIKTYTFPYVFTSGLVHRDRLIALDQQAYPFCSYNTMNPNGGHPICQNFIGQINMPDADFAAASDASEAAFVNSFQNLYNPDIHDVLTPLPDVAGKNISADYFPYPPAAAGVAATAKEAFKVVLAHAEMVAYVHFINSYNDVIGGLGIPTDRVRAVILNIAVTRDTCARCHRTLYLKSFEDIALALAAAAMGAPPAAAPTVPLLINISAIRDYEGSRPADDILARANNRNPAAGHPPGGILYLYR